MSAIDATADQRDTYRCPVAESRQDCTLQVSDAQYAGRLMDESAGGFSVMLEKKPQLEVKDTAHLVTDSGRFKVRVMYLAETSPPIGCRLPDSEAPTQWFRLGLRRIGDADSPEEPKTTAFDWSFGLRKRDVPSQRGGFPVTGIFLAFVGVAVPLCLIALFWLTRNETIDVPIRAKDPWASWGNKKWSKPNRPTNESPFISAPAGKEQSPFDSPGEGFGTKNASGSNSETRLQGLIRRMPGPTALTMPEVIKRFGITDGQLERIREIADTMAEKIRELPRDSQLRGDREAINLYRDSLENEYLRQALEILTPEQRAEWDKLHNQPPAN